MTNPSGFGAGARLTFHGPLSAGRANRLAADLAAGSPASVTEYGCGWGEFLLRAKLDAHRSIWLRGHRDVLGFAYLTLGVPQRGTQARLTASSWPTRHRASPARQERQ